MYNQIRSLESKLSDTVKKYENLLSLIEESDIKLDKSGQNIEKISIELSRSLKEHLLHIDSLKGSNEIIKSDIFKIYEYISDIKKELVQQDQKNELLKQKISDNQVIFEHNFKGINQSLSEIKYDVENEQKTIIQIKGDIDRSNKKLSENIKKNIENISNDLDKRFKTQNILIVIIIVFLIVNIFFK